MSDKKDFYTIKFIPYRKNLGDIMYRQSKDRAGFSSDGRYRFYINEDIENPDFVVVQGKGLRTKAEYCVAPENTIFLTTEPSSVLIYPQDYIKQFGLVCSCQSKMKHPNLVLGPPILPWFIGYTESKDGACKWTLDYDILKKAPTPSKTKLISVITSNKAFSKGHLDRIKFVEKLKNKYGDKIDIFGRGYNDFDDKWDVLAPYKYHIVIENSSQDYYWTEKISDCFLAETFPIYSGCTNLKDYFPENSFCPIDINRFEEASQLIDETINNGFYEKNLDVLRISKDKVLEAYNFFNYVASLCDSLNPSANKELISLNPCKPMHSLKNMYNYTIGRNLYKWENSFRLFVKHDTLSQ